MILTIVLYCSFIKTYVSAYIGRRYRDKEYRGGSIKINDNEILGKAKKRENKEYQVYSVRLCMQQKKQQVFVKYFPDCFWP